MNIQTSDRRRVLTGISLALAGMTTALARPASAQQSPGAGSGERRTVMVEAFEGAELTGGLVSADGLSSLMVEVLMESGRFSVVEKGSNPANVRFLLKGSITRYNPAASGAGVQLGGFSGLGRAVGAGAHTRTTIVGISLRLIEAGTGQIVAIGKAEGSARARDADAGLLNPRTGSTMGVSAMRSTSLGEALEGAMKGAVAELAGKV